MTRSAKGLPPRQRRFVERYLATGQNATQAAKDAGYSPRTAASQGSRLLKDVKVKAAIAAALDRAGLRDHLKASKILRQVGRIAFGDPRRFFDATGRLKPIQDLDDDAAALLAGFDVVTRAIPGTDPVEVEHVVKIKLRDTKGALELLGKYRKLQLWRERHEHEHKVTLEDLVAGAAEEEKPGGR